MKTTAMVTLDLSAAFDTVNHKILIKVLENYFGIWEKASNWIIVISSIYAIPSSHQWNILRKNYNKLLSTTREYTWSFTV